MSEGQDRDHRAGSGRRRADTAFREILAASRLIITITDTRRRYTWLYNPDPAFDPRDLIGKRDEDVVPLEAVAELVRLKEQVLETGEEVQEVIEIEVDGRSRHYDMLVHPKRDPESGEITGLATVGVDVTEQIQKRAGFEEWVGRLEETGWAMADTILRQRNSLREQTRNLRWLSARLTELEQRERQRLARLLHDDLQQLLVAASLQAESLDGSAGGWSEEERETLRKIEGLLDDAQQVSREMVTRLSPPILDGAPLSDVLHWLVEQMRRLHGLEVTLQIEEGLESRKDPLRRLLFDIGRELLLNVVKHAGVRTCGMRLNTTAEEWFRLEVEDRGEGIDPDDPPDPEDPYTFGLFSMRHRLESVGGSIVIRSGPGRGTLVRVELPPDAF